jgi:hypothetical protein
MRLDTPFRNAENPDDATDPARVSAAWASGGNASRTDGGREKEEEEFDVCCCVEDDDDDDGTGGGGGVQPGGRPSLSNWSTDIAADGLIEDGGGADRPARIAAL